MQQPEISIHPLIGRLLKKLSPRNIPQIHIHKPLNNIPSPPRLKRRIQKRQNHIITHTLHSLQNPGSPQRPPSKPNQQTFTTIIIQNPPKINLNITQKLQHPPHTHNTSSAALMAHRLPAHHKKTQPHTPKKQNGQTASHPTKKEPQAQTPRNSPKTKQHHLPLRNFLSSLSNRSARAVTENL